MFDNQQKLKKLPCDAPAEIIKNYPVTHCASYWLSHSRFALAAWRNINLAAAGSHNMHKTGCRMALGYSVHCHAIGASIFTISSSILILNLVILIFAFKISQHIFNTATVCIIFEQFINSHAL